MFQCALERARDEGTLATLNDAISERGYAGLSDTIRGDEYGNGEEQDYAWKTMGDMFQSCWSRHYLPWFSMHFGQNIDQNAIAKWMRLTKFLLTAPNAKLKEWNDPHSLADLQEATTLFLPDSWIGESMNISMNFFLIANQFRREKTCRRRNGSGRLVCDKTVDERLMHFCSIECQSWEVYHGKKALELITPAGFPRGYLGLPEKLETSSTFARTLILPAKSVVCFGSEVAPAPKAIAPGKHDSSDDEPFASSCRKAPDVPSAASTQATAAMHQTENDAMLALSLAMEDTDDLPLIEMVKGMGLNAAPSGGSSSTSASDFAPTTAAAVVSTAAANPAASDAGDEKYKEQLQYAAQELSDCARTAMNMTEVMSKCGAGPLQDLLRDPRAAQINEVATAALAFGQAGGDWPATCRDQRG